MSAELAVIERGREVLKRTSDLKTIATALVSDEVPETRGQIVEFPKLPAPRAYTTELAANVAQIPGVFGRVNLDARRTLSDQERTEVYMEHKVLDFVSKLLDRRVEDLKKIVRTDMDMRAEEAAVAVPKPILGPKGEVIVPATPRDKDGHYILARPGVAHKVPVPGTDRVYSQEYKNGSVQVDGEKLVDLLMEGVITRGEYLALTRETRVLDETKAGAFIRDNPERGMEILKEITTHGAPSTQLYVRKA